MTNVQKLIERIYGQPIKEIIRKMYVEDGMTLEAIGEELGVATSTVYRWVTEFSLHQKRPPWNYKLTKEERIKIAKLTE